ncbi:MAG: ATP-binding cassette domain-containing protein [Microbacterium sp.]
MLATEHSIAAYGIVGAERYGPVFLIALFLVRPLSYCLITWATLRVVRRLTAAGVGGQQPRIRLLRRETTDVEPGERPLVEARELTVRHPDAARARPDGVSLRVAPGEVLLVLGPSGSGKSTLALSLNGLVPQAIPAEVTGSVHVAGLDTARHPVAGLAGRIGMVFQDPDAQVVTTRVLDEVCFGPENLLVPADEVLRRAEQALRSVGLWDRRDDDPATLSGGGRQRLAIACALAAGAPLIVLDEPTANLDSAAVVEVYAVLRELTRELGIGLVLIEHDLDSAIELVDTVLVLDAAGRTAFHGPVREVLIGHARELLALGVWLPVAALAALRLEDAGTPMSPLPLTVDELAQRLDETDALPAPPAEDAAVPPGAEAIVRVRSLTAAHGDRTVLDGVDLDIAAGEFLAILGVNGAGKTSLLHRIAGVIAPPAGTVQVAGLDPASADPTRLAGRIGYVFQNPEHQFVADTVADELAHGLRVQGADEQVVRERVEEMLHRLGLAELRDRHPFRLSGGQKRRLSVGTALIVEPAVLALDEPTYGQDREHAVALLSLLEGLHRQGTTIVMVTHDTQLVADYASHAAVLSAGRLLAHDTVAAVLAGPELHAAGVLPPPLVRATAGLRRHPHWRGIARLGDLPEART